MNWSHGALCLGVTNFCSFFKLVWGFFFVSYCFETVWLSDLGQPVSPYPVLGFDPALMVHFYFWYFLINLLVPWLHVLWLLQKMPEAFIRLECLEISQSNYFLSTTPYKQSMHVVGSNLSSRSTTQTAALPEVGEGLRIEARWWSEPLQYEVTC
jgi:hypothetical protein